MKKVTNILWHSKSNTWLEKEDLFIEKSDDNLLVESLHSFISQGTERTMISSKLSPDLAKSMRVPFMKGSLNDVFTYGYSSVGRVISGNNEMIGKHIHVMHPHQDFFIVDAQSVFEIPKGIDLKTATLASNLETAVNALWDASIEIGDKVQIIGYGIIGALIAKLIKQIPGITLEIKELDNQRIKAAQRLGYHVIKKTQRKDHDIIFNTSSGKDSLQQAMKDSKTEATIVELSWYGVNTTSLKLGGEFHYGRKKIISSQVSQIPFRKQPNWNYKNRKELVFKLLNEIDFSDLITNEIDYLTTPDFYRKLRNNKINNLGTIINY